MTLLIRYWLDLCLLRAAPQDGPASTFVLGLALTCYAMISVLVLTASYGMLVGAGLAVLDLLLLVTFILVLLYLSGKITRTYQTLAAMFGAGSLLGLCAMPLVLLNNPSTEDATLPAVASMASGPVPRRDSQWHARPQDTVTHGPARNSAVAPPRCRFLTVSAKWRCH